MFVEIPVHIEHSPVRKVHVNLDKVISIHLGKGLLDPTGVGMPVHFQYSVTFCFGPDHYDNYGPYTKEQAETIYNNILDVLNGSAK